MSYDPYSTKVNSSQPSHASVYSPVGTTAQPPAYPAAGNHVRPVAQSLPQQQQPIGPASQPVVYAQRAPPGRWKDGICDWCNNLYPSCYCTCCCFYGMWLVGQMSQKVGYVSFNTVVWVTAGIWLLGLILSLATGAGIFVIVITMLFSFFASICLRLYIVRTEGITECGPFGEFCTAFWCWYCSVSQMARHLYGYKQVLDGDGDPYRPDDYAPVQSQEDQV